MERSAAALERAQQDMTPEVQKRLDEKVDISATLPQMNGAVLTAELQP